MTRRRAEEITVALTPRSLGELEEVMDRESLSRTDAINRAIGLYAIASEELAAGRELAFKDGDTIQVVTIL